MSIASRLLLGFTLVIGLGGAAAYQLFARQLRPHARQAVEESLVDFAAVLAELIARDVRETPAGPLPDLEQALTAAATHRVSARIYGIEKTETELHIYVTDRAGTVRADSRSRDVGQNYSQWNDVARTLRGEYGVRTTRTDPKDPATSTMYVAAPIVVRGERVGVVSVGKPSARLQLYLDQASHNVQIALLALLAITAVVALLVAASIVRPIQKLTDYALAVAAGQRRATPRFGSSELGALARALESMRQELDGKQYALEYTQTLAHAMKGPLSGISAASEILSEQPSDAAPLADHDRQRFLTLIGNESARLRRLVDNAGRLARVENIELNLVRTALAPLLARVAEAEQNGPRARAQQVTLRTHVDDALFAPIDAAAVEDALRALVENAIDFAAAGSHIDISAAATDGHVVVSVLNTGDPIPDYALARVFERFYSLPRPGGGARSSGLGLALVQAVAQAHGGHGSIVNCSIVNRSIVNDGGARISHVRAQFTLALSSHFAPTPLSK